MTAMPKAVPQAPVVDLDRIQRTYAELKKMEIRLDANPIDYGPKRFNNRIAQVRAMLTRLEQIFLQTSEDRHYFQRIISKKHALYELDRRELMVKDLEVRSGPTRGEREDRANLRLRESVEELQELGLSVEDLESLMVVIKSKRTDLKDIQGRMRDQMKLIEHDLGMGARWGRTPVLAPVAVADDGPDVIEEMIGTALSIIEEETEEEDSAEEGETLVETDDATEEEEPTEEPAPPPEPEPVLVFGDEEISDEETSDDPDLEDLIPVESDKGTFPEEKNEGGDADGFLDAIGSLDPEEEQSEDALKKEEQSIDDLLASFSED